jgi:hypothetical protein
MSALTDRIDRFVRWFFNSSPTATEIQPQEPNREHREERDGRLADKAPGPRQRRRPRAHHQERASA